MCLSSFELSDMPWMCLPLVGSIFVVSKGFEALENIGEVVNSEPFSRSCLGCLAIDVCLISLVHRHCEEKGFVLGKLRLLKHPWAKLVILT